ncbi:MAG TPA: hypothetical protein VEG34_00020 [Thermoanaerobaculia bacterium]|nr:hypothetical protein [Thermoanaerobaculia bacterium]
MYHQTSGTVAEALERALWYHLGIEPAETTERYASGFVQPVPVRAPNRAKMKSPATSSEMVEGVVSAPLGAVGKWPPQRSLQTAAVLLVIAGGTNLSIMAVLLSWGARLGVPILVTTGLQAFLAVALLVFGRQAAIPTFSLLSAAAFCLLIRNAYVMVARFTENTKGWEFSSAEFAVAICGLVLPLALITFFYVLPFALLLVGKQGRARYAIALAAFTLFELLSIGSMVASSSLPRGLP